jgi:hypothetical protein
MPNSVSILRVCFPMLFCFACKLCLSLIIYTCAHCPYLNAPISAQALHIYCTTTLHCFVPYYTNLSNLFGHKGRLIHLLLFHKASMSHPNNIHLYTQSCNFPLAHDAESPTRLMKHTSLSFSPCHLDQYHSRRTNSQSERISHLESENETMSDLRVRVATLQDQTAVFQEAYFCEARKSAILEHEMGAIKMKIYVLEEITRLILASGLLDDQVLEELQRCIEKRLDSESTHEIQRTVDSSGDVHGHGSSVSNPYPASDIGSMESSSEPQIRPYVPTFLRPVAGSTACPPSPRRSCHATAQDVSIQ